MGLRFISVDADGAQYDWRLERGGRLFVRSVDNQRWRFVTEGITGPTEAKRFIKTAQGHKEVHNG